MFAAVWFWMLAWALWWLNAQLGAQGASPILAVISILSLPILLKTRPTFSKDAIAFLSFLAWCVITNFWSPMAGDGLFTINLDTMNLAISSPGLRIAVTSAMAMFAFWALHNLSDKDYRLGLVAMRIGFAGHILFMLAWIVAFNTLMDFAMTMTDGPSEFQNLVRNINLSAMMLPLVAICLPISSVVARSIFGLLLSVGLVSLMYRSTFDAEAAGLALFVIVLAILLTRLIGRHIYRVMGVATAAGILTMPAVVHFAVKLIPYDALPLSVQSRLVSWSYVLEKIWQKPLWGWGVQASRTWDETRPIIAPNGMLVEYRIVPGHPHNGALQLWAETGLIGVIILAIFAVLLGDRLSRTCSKSTQIIMAGASLWAGSVVFGAISYSVWNDAFWASIALLGTGVFTLSKLHAIRPEAQLA